MPSESKQIPIRKLRCPRCGDDPYLLRELWRNHVIEFEVSNGRRKTEGILNEGDPYAVEATCDCGHSWRLRGVRQIINLDKETPE